MSKKYNENVDHKQDELLTVIQATYFVEGDISIDTKWIGISQSFMNNVKT